MCRSRVDCLRVGLVSLVVELACAAADTKAATFLGLGDLPGGSFDSRAFGISADGAVVVGAGTTTDGQQAFRRTSGGMVGLGDLGELPTGGSFSYGQDVSTNGAIVVGGTTSTAGLVAFRWTSGGMVGLGDLPGGAFSSSATSVSGNGSVVVGSSESAAGFEAFRWTTSGGMTGLGDLAGGGFGSGATAVSANGSVVVGYGQSSSLSEAFRWTAAGMVGLGDLPGGSTFSQALAVSPGGSVVAGWGFSPSGREAFRWTADGGGMAGLGDLPGGEFYSEALGISAHGSVVVGTSRTAAGNEAFRWTATGGMQNLRNLLIADGATGLADWRLTSAYAVTPDGSTIVGVGVNPSGNDEAWIATLPFTGASSADFDEDGDVDGRDYLIWQRGESTRPLSQSDLQLWRAQYGAIAELASLAVPEPASAALVMVAVALLMRRGSLNVIQV